VTAPFELQFPVGLIRDLAGKYGYADDEPVLRIGASAKVRGYFTKPEFVEVCRWKTPRSQPRVARNTAEEIEEATGLALAAKSEALRIEIPRALAGATASVLLHLAHTDPYPILDYRALEALGINRVPTYTVPFWNSYVAACRTLATSADVDMRTLDRALWQWSKERRPPKAAARC
jgi:hypothetical protein